MYSSVSNFIQSLTLGRFMNQSSYELYSHNQIQLYYYLFNE
ncbi:MAG: hypothetical protein PARBA_01106 [Parabacteroides sp.]